MWGPAADTSPTCAPKSRARCASPASARTCRKRRRARRTRHVQGRPCGLREGCRVQRAQWQRRRRKSCGTGGVSLRLCTGAASPSRSRTIRGACDSECRASVSRLQIPGREHRDPVCLCGAAGEGGCEYLASHWHQRNDVEPPFFIRSGPISHRALAVSSKPTSSRCRAPEISPGRCPSRAAL